MTVLPELAELATLAERRHRDPAAILRRAAELGASGDDAVAATAAWVAGLALHELGRAAEAVVSYRGSVETSGRLGLADVEALARAGMAISLLSTGDAAGAQRQIAVAVRRAPPGAAGAVAMLHGLVLQRTGRLDDALSTYQAALTLLDAGGDLASVARLRLNRGTLLAYQGALAPALDDLAEAERLATQRQLPVLAAMAAHNTGFAHGRRGNLPEALDAFDRAEAAYRDLDQPARLVAVLEADRCEVLLLAGLVAEAQAAATAAVDALVSVGDQAHLGEARLLVARTL
ncbi:MAG: hypothetical protein ACRDZW_03285, partial [Acidimicrobiales bacterium]